LQNTRTVTTAPPRASTTRAGESLEAQPSGQTNAPLVIEQGVLCSSLGSVEAANECMDQQSDRHSGNGASGKGDTKAKTQ
jgi:hypothetical protein